MSIIPDEPDRDESEQDQVLPIDDDRDNKTTDSLSGTTPEAPEDAPPLMDTNTESIDHPEVGRGNKSDASEKS